MGGRYVGLRDAPAKGDGAIREPREHGEVLEAVSLPTPFWRSDDGRHTVYCGDCRQVLPVLPKCELVIADPPYEIRTGGGGMHSRREGLKNIASMGIDTFTPSEFMPDIWSVCQHGYFWTSKNCLRDFTAWIECADCNWDLLTMAKRNPIPAKNNKYLPDTELILFLRGDDCFWNNKAPYDYYRKVKWTEVHPPEFGHPTEKPVDICQELIEISSRQDETILDPFMGSGTTGVACIRTGRKFIGIELEPKYCSIAVERMERELAQPRLPGMEPERMSQSSFPLPSQKVP